MKIAIQIVFCLLILGHILLAVPTASRGLTGA